MQTSIHSNPLSLPGAMNFKKWELLSGSSVVLFVLMLTLLLSINCHEGELKTVSNATVIKVQRKD